VPLAFAVALALGSAARAAVAWKDAPRQPDTWHATAEARALAATVILYQHESGGWPKNTDFSKPPTPNQLVQMRRGANAPTIDNGGTTTPLRFLARIISTNTPEAALQARIAFARGFDYLLAAQYENGGWPQYFPLREGYYTHITYNDNAMVNVLTLLRDASRGDPPYAFVDGARRERAAAAVKKGVECILRTQVKQNGALTAWCAQHDEKTLEPAWARKYEPPSLSGSESVGIVRFLMAIEKPTPEIVASIEGAAAWLDKAKLTGIRVEKVRDSAGKSDRRVASATEDAPPLWARFYELGTDRPLFLDRDSVPHYDYSEITRERRAGYSYYATAPASLLKTEYPRWRERLGLPASSAKSASLSP
jgi:PelA/Pel-15E family pectate lyase